MLDYVGGPKVVISVLVNARGEQRNQSARELTVGFDVQKGATS